MTIYIFLIIILYIAFLIDHSGNTSPKRTNLILFAVFVFIFLICVLRSSSVGRDIPGYEKVYELTKSIPWSEYGYVYFENGYVFLMKVCCSLGLSFQWFMVVCYLIILIPLYYFIKYYSKDKVLSVVVFICYMFFEFSLTALRQTISMSISLLGLMTLLSHKKMKTVFYCLAVFGASLFHKGAFICFLLIPFLRIRYIEIFTVLISIFAGMSLLARKYLFSLIKVIFAKSSFSVNATLHIGFNLILLILLAVLFLLVQINQSRNGGSSFGDELLISVDSDGLLFKVYMISIVVALFFGNETSARSFMYFSQSVIVLLPNSLKSYF